MRRREFITLLGGATVAWPLAARAQQPSVPVIGFMSARSPEDSVSVLQAFYKGLKDEGGDSVKQEDFDTVFYPGGHGPMWDLAEDRHSITLIESFLAARKPIGIVCHSTGALHHVKTPDGKFLVQGKEVTGFTNGEEEAVGLTKVVPFLVEDEMLKLGAVFSKKANWEFHVAAMDC
jgi:hypothetical protein